MSANQEPQVSFPTWRCSDYNAAVPIKKRKFFVQPAIEEADSAVLLQKNTLPDELGDSTSGCRSSLDSSPADENQKLVGGKPISSFPFVPTGNSGSTMNINLGQVRVKVEETNGFETPSSSNIFGSSLHSSLGKLPVGDDHRGVALTSDETGLKVEQAVCKTRDIERETFGKENLRGKCVTEASSGVGTDSRRLDCRTNNNSPYWENREPKALNLSLSEDVFAPQNTDSVSVCAKSGNHCGVNRSNWDLNTTMDAWEDGLDRTTRVKTVGEFLNSNRSLHDVETSCCRDTTLVTAKPVSKKQKETLESKSPTLSLAQFDHQVNPTCSLSLGLSSYPPIEKSPPLSATLSEARVAFTSFSRPIMVAGNMNSVNLRTVKSEVIEESVRQEADSAQVCQVGLPIKGGKQEAVGRFSQENSPSSGILNPVDPITIKAEPNNFTQSEVVYRRDGTLNYHLHKPITESNEDLDLPTSSTPKEKEKYIRCSVGIGNAPTSLDGMTINPGVQSYPENTLKENLGQSSSAAEGKLCEVPKHGGVDMTYSYSGHGGDNLNASGVNVTSMTKEKILDDCKTRISKGLPCKSRGTDELSISDDQDITLSGKEENLYSNGFESDFGRDLSRVIKKENGKRILHDDGKVQGPASVCAEGNEVSNTNVGGYEAEQRDIKVPFHSDFRNSNHVEEKGSQSAFLGYKGESEHQIDQDGEKATHQIIRASEGMSGVSTVSGGNLENPEIADNSSPFSYKAEISTCDNDPVAGFSEGSHSRIINLAQVSNNSPMKTLDASGSFVSSRMERDRLPDFPLEPRKYLLRGSDESCKFSRERYQGKNMRSPRLNFMSDRRSLSDKTESNLPDRDTKNFEFDNYGNNRRGRAFVSNYNRGRRPANDEVTTFSHSFPRRTRFTHRGPTNEEDASAFNGFRDGEKFTRRLQCNNTEPMFMSPQRPYQGQSSCYARGRIKYSNNHERRFTGFRSRSPIRSRERLDGPSSSFRNRSQEDFSERTDFSRRSSPSGYRMETISSPDHSGCQREMVVRRNSSPPYLHRPSNAGRGRGYARGRGYVRGRGYGRDGTSFRKPSDHVIHRYHGNLNNLDPRERVDYSDDFFTGTTHSERFGVDTGVERRRFGFRHDGTKSFRPSFSNDGCVPTNVENDHDALRFGQPPDTEINDQGTVMEIDGKNKNSSKNASGSNMEEEETTKHSKMWQRDELRSDGF